MEKKVYKASDIRDMLVEFESLIQTLKGDLSSPNSIERGLLAISTLSSWIITLYDDGYPYLFSRVVINALQHESDELCKDTHIRHVCAELNKVLLRYRNQSVHANRAVTKVIVSHKLTLDYESMLGENLAIIKLLEDNSRKGKVESTEIIHEEGDAEAVQKCSRFVKKAQEVIIPELSPLVETLSEYLTSIYLTEMDEVEHHAGPAAVLYQISAN